MFTGMGKMGRVIALGFFDGIHIGHAALMKRAVSVARESGLIPSVITFDAHPLGIVTGKAAPMIPSPADRVDLILRLFGITDVILLHFDGKTAAMPWEEFIDFLINEHGARHLIAGSDFRFGKGGAGNPGLLARKCAVSGIGCDVISEVTFDGTPVRSTYIRELISRGDIEKANMLLGHPHVLSGIAQCPPPLDNPPEDTVFCLPIPGHVIVPAPGVYATTSRLADGTPAAGHTRICPHPESGGAERHTAKPRSEARYLAEPHPEACYLAEPHPVVWYLAETRLHGRHDAVYGISIRLEFLRYLG